MKKFEILIFFSLFLFLVPSTLAQTIGIAVEPTVAQIFLSNLNPQTILIIKLWNPASTDINYTLVSADDLKPFIMCSNYYWCYDKFYIVNANTNKSNAAQIHILFSRSGSSNLFFNSSILVKATPITQENSTVSIIPQIAIRVSLNQTNIVITTTTTSTTQNNPETGSNPTSTTTSTSSTSTTTHTTTSTKITFVPPVQNFTTLPISPPLSNKTINTKTIHIKIDTITVVIAVVIIIVIIVGTVTFLRWY